MVWPRWWGVNTQTETGWWVRWVKSAAVYTPGIDVCSCRRLLNTSASAQQSLRRPRQVKSQVTPFIQPRAGHFTSPSMRNQVQQLSLRLTFLSPFKSFNKSCVTFYMSMILTCTTFQVQFGIRQIGSRFHRCPFLQQSLVLNRSSLCCLHVSYILPKVHRCHKSISSWHMQVIIHKPLHCM